jgi:hypothetical protein
MLTFRVLRSSDPFPDTLNTGYEKMPVMKNWVWVAEESDETVGILLAAPMHGLVYLMVVRTKGDDGAIFLGLLRQCFKDCIERGFKAFWMHVDPTKVESRFIKIVRRMGGTQHVDPQTMLSCELGLAARY